MRPLLLTLLVLIVVSVCMTVVCMGYGVVNVNVPYPDPTPAQAAAEKHHMGVSDWLMTGAGMSWLVTLGAAVGLGVWWVVRRMKIRAEAM